MYRRITEESIAERTKLSWQILNIIEKNKKKINNKLFKEYFNYSNPDTMKNWKMKVMKKIKIW